LFFGQAKVSNLQNPLLLINEDVSRLDVPVDQSLFVDVLQAIEYLFEEGEVKDSVDCSPLVIEELS